MERANQLSCFNVNLSLEMTGSDFLVVRMLCYFGYLRICPAHTPPDILFTYSWKRDARNDGVSLQNIFQVDKIACLFWIKILVKKFSFF